MKIEEAIEILKYHKKWRHDDTGELRQTDSKKLDEALDTVVEHYERT